MLRTFDMDTIAWKGGYQPDLVVINLGSNDFAVPPVPSEDEFVDGYCNLLSQIRTQHGNIPVICVCPPTTGEPLSSYLKKAAERMSDPDIHVIILKKVAGCLMKSVLFVIIIAILVAVYFIFLK